MLFARCASSWSHRDSAGVGLGRARVVSRRRVLFSIICQTIPSVFSYVWVHTNLGGEAGRYSSQRAQGGWFESRMVFFFHVGHFHCLLVLTPRVLLPVQKHVRWRLRCCLSKRQVIFTRIQSAAAGAVAALCVAILLLLPQHQFCCFLLLFVIVCRGDKIVAGTLNLIPVLSFSSLKRDVLFMYPFCLHTR